jgi:hypothetical protein
VAIRIPPDPVVGDRFHASGSRVISPAFVRSAAVLFAISCAFPVAASLVPAAVLPIWIGYLDVVLAFIVAGLAIRISMADDATKPVDTVRLVKIYRAIGAVPLVLLVAFFLVGDRVRWDVLLPGLAWRAWIMMYTLPAVVGMLPRLNAAGRDLGPHTKEH